MVICLERGADLHMAQLMPPPLTVSCFCTIQIGFTFLAPAHPGSPRKTAVKRVCVCVCVCAGVLIITPLLWSFPAGDCLNCKYGFVSSSLLPLHLAMLLQNAEAVVSAPAISLVPVVFWSKQVSDL